MECHYITRSISGSDNNNNTDENWSGRMVGIQMERGILHILKSVMYYIYGSVQAIPTYRVCWLNDCVYTCICTHAVMEILYITLSGTPRTFYLRLRSIWTPQRNLWATPSLHWLFKTLQIHTLWMTTFWPIIPIIPCHQVNQIYRSCYIWPSMCFRPCMDSV